MKTKLTLSIDKAKVAALRKASARRSTTISALVEDMADQLEKEARSDDQVPDWLAEMGTWLEGKVTQKDLEEDPRLAYAYGYKPKQKTLKIKPSKKGR
ncbi:MAG: DUF6364 family protein [Bacteroidota bacterium]|nr:DUF6364 family protein [Bacteroidota bacterium]